MWRRLTKKFWRMEIYQRRWRTRRKPRIGIRSRSTYSQRNASVGSSSRHQADDVVVRGTNDGMSVNGNQLVPVPQATVRGGRAAGQHLANRHLRPFLRAAEDPEPEPFVHAVERDHSVDEVHVAACVPERHLASSRQLPRYPWRKKNYQLKTFKEHAVKPIDYRCEDRKKVGELRGDIGAIR